MMSGNGGFRWSLFFFYLVHWGSVLVVVLVSYLVLVLSSEGLDFSSMFFGSLVVAVVSSILFFVHLSENEASVEEKAAMLVLSMFFYIVVFMFLYLM